MIKLQKFLTLFVGIGAVMGAVMMWIDPSGQMWGGVSNIYFVFGLMEVVAAMVSMRKERCNQ